MNPSEFNTSFIPDRARGTTGVGCAADVHGVGRDLLAGMLIPPRCAAADAIAEMPMAFIGPGS